MVLNIDHIIQRGGVLLVAAIIFAESGLLVGFFLPGDTLLFGAGLAASQGKFSLIWLIIAVIGASILGDNVGYSIGRRTGPRLFNKKDSILFHQDYVKRAQSFYEKHGGKTIILARFIPIIRTFAPVVAGVGKMPRRRFFFFNIFGGIFWGGGMAILGYEVGSRIPHLDKYIDWAILGVVVISVALAVFHMLKDQKTRVLIRQKVRLTLRNIFLNKNID